MNISESIEPSIHLTLKELIEQKAQRDKSKFNAGQLAEALGMPRSMITKLTHFDKSKRVLNPRIDTLIKIVDFFRADGFNITLDDLIGRKTKTINIKNQAVIPHSHMLTLPVYGFSKPNDSLGVIDIKLSEKYKRNLFGLLAEVDVKPFFKSGSIFIIDPDAPLEDDVLVAVKLAGEMTQIKKYTIKKNKISLKSLDENENEIALLPTSTVQIMGVVIQVNAKTADVYR